jgi:hypothetical protein
MRAMQGRSCDKNSNNAVRISAAPQKNSSQKTLKFSKTLKFKNDYAII